MVDLIRNAKKVWAITTTHVTQNFGYYVLLTELPTYMKNILHFDMKSNAVLSGDSDDDSGGKNNDKDSDEEKRG